jgi:hypothetical protein
MIGGQIIAWMLRYVGAATALTVLLLTGCDSTEIDPFIESERYFSIYGSLEMEFTEQYLRVVPIDTQIGTVDYTIDARVKAIDLQTGEEWEWRDSLFTFPDGKVGHVFVGSFRIKAGHTYRIEVTRSDGARSWAETTVPAEPGAELGDGDVIGGTGFPRGTQDVIWRGLSSEPHRVDVYYRFWELKDEPFIDLRIPYETTDSSPEIGGDWSIRVNYGRDHSLLSPVIAGKPWRLAGTAMRITVLAEDWVPPGGVWDPEILSQPGVFSNVQNGFGYVGSSGRFSIEWIP